MVKGPKKPTKTSTNTMNSILTEKSQRFLAKQNKTSPKPKQQIDKEYYQKNKEKKKTKQKLNYTKKKQKEQEQLNKYYQASNIKVLMSFKEYTELNKEKRKLWLDFNWTLKDCQVAIKEGLGDIVAIMKLREGAENLVRDYWETAKGEIKKGKSWNILSEEQQQRLIRYWGYEKARIENSFLDTAERLERESKEYLKEIELAKFHEERGKDKCECYRCAESKRIQGEIKKELFKENESDKEQCPECKKWVKELDEESGVCKRCKKKYE